MPCAAVTEFAFRAPAGVQRCAGGGFIGGYVGLANEVFQPPILKEVSESVLWA